MTVTTRRMRMARAVVAGAVWAALVCGGSMAAAQTSDRVIASGGSLIGKVVGTSPDEVQVEDRNGEIKKAPIDKIKEVQFAGEPASLRAARSLLTRGRGGEALEEVAKVENSELDGADPLVLAEMQYVKAAGAARMALDTGAKLNEANALVAGFLGKNPQSHHTYEMREILGDLLGRAGKLKEAGEAYAVLAKGPPAFRIRAATANGRLAFDQGKYDDAIRAYDSALQIAADDEASLAQKQAASLGKARSLAQAGRHADAVELVQKIIKDADPEAKEMLARAYAALGAVYRSTGDKDQDSLISYLMVDLVYNTVPECHAEALYNLAELWEKGKNPERAREARENLAARYPASPWKRKLDDPAKSS